MPICIISVGRNLSESIDPETVFPDTTDGKQLRAAVWLRFRELIRAIADEHSTVVHFAGSGWAPTTSERTFTVIFETDDPSPLPELLHEACTLFHQDCAALTVGGNTTFPGPRPW